MMKSACFPCILATWPSPLHQVSWITSRIHDEIGIDSCEPFSTESSGMEMSTGKSAGSRSPFADSKISGEDLRREPTIADLCGNERKWEGALRALPCTFAYFMMNSRLDFSRNARSARSARNNPHTSARILDEFGIENEGYEYACLRTFLRIL